MGRPKRLKPKVAESAEAAEGSTTEAVLAGLPPPPPPAEKAQSPRSQPPPEGKQAGWSLWSPRSLWSSNENEMPSAQGGQLPTSGLRDVEKVSSEGSSHVSLDQKLKMVKADARYRDIRETVLVESTLEMQAASAWSASARSSTVEESEKLLSENADAAHGYRFDDSDETRWPVASPLLWEEKMPRSTEYSRWCLVVGTVAILAATVGTVIPSVQTRGRGMRRASAVEAWQPSTTMSPVVALLSGYSTTTTVAPLVDATTTVEEAIVTALRDQGIVVTTDSNESLHEALSQASGTRTTTTTTTLTRSDKFAAQGDVAICNPKLGMPKQDQLRTWAVDPSWMTLCHVNDKDHEFPNRDRNWCWVGFKNQCHMNRDGREKSWADVQDLAYRAGRVPPVDQAPFAPLQNAGLCDRPSLGAAQNWTHGEWAIARAWFQNHVRVYVLSLPGETKRWNKISSRLRELSINAERVGGVDMHHRDTMEQAMTAGWVPSPFNYSRAEQAAQRSNSEHAHASQRRPSGGHDLDFDIKRALGSAAAHFRAVSRIAESDATLGLVLEDDTWLESDFVPRLWNMVSVELPCDWTVVSLLTRCGYGRCISPHLSRVQPDGNEPENTCRHGVNLGTHAMLYRSNRLESLKKTWQRAVFDEDRPDCFNADVALASISDRVAYYAVPGSQAPGFVRVQGA